MAASLAQRIYWKAPYRVKCWMASWKARLQDRVRFGPDYDGVLRQLAERRAWTAERFRDYRDARLREMVRHAAAHVPYYRALFREHGIDPQSIRGAGDLPRLPVLLKETVRTRARDLVDERRDRKRLIGTHTSGTTGTALELYRDSRVFSHAFAFLDARMHDVAGVRRRSHRSVSIGVYLVADLKRDRPPFWVENAHWKQLYMSCYHLSQRHLGSYVEELRRYRGDYIEGYPSSIYAVARHIVDNGLEPVPFQACFTTAETLAPHQREAIRRAFGCRVYDQYGCAEMAVFAAECEEGSMHISIDYGIVEVADAGFRPVAPGETGQLICTSLVNDVQPFLRYQVGDLGSLREGACPCGNPLPMLGHIEGRTDHVLLMRSGRQVGRLDPVFKDTYGIAAAQVVQEDWGVFRLRIVPGKSYSDAEGERARTTLREYLGEGEIAVELVDEIERTASGKFRALVCNLPSERRGSRGRPDGSGP